MASVYQIHMNFLSDSLPVFSLFKSKTQTILMIETYAQLSYLTGGGSTYFFLQFFFLQDIAGFFSYKLYSYHPVLFSLYKISNKNLRFNFEMLNSFI